jgi:hypothetical protein
MKKTIYSLSLLLMLFSLISCDDEKDDTSAPGVVQNLKFVSGYGMITLTWENPTDEDFRYTDIRYKIKDKEYSNKVSSFADSVTIMGFPAKGDYTFNITTVDKSDNRSSVVDFTATSDSSAFNVVASSVTAIADFGGAKIGVKNTTNQSVVIDVKYKDDKGATIVKTYSNTESTEINISGLNTDKRDFEVKVYDKNKEYSSEPKVFEITPLLEIEIDKTNWEIVDFSSDIADGNSGLIKYVIDGDVNTFWHSNWADASKAYPHHFVIDMKEPAVVSRFQIARRQGDNRGFVKCAAYVSNDGTNFTHLGDFDFDAESDEFQSYSVKTEQKYRYFKFVALEGPNFYAFLAEINIFGSL